MGIVYTRHPGRPDQTNPQRAQELLAAAEQAGWPPVYIQPEQKPVSPWSDGPAHNIGFAGEQGWRAFVQLAGAAQTLAAQRLLLCILIGMADTVVGEPDGMMVGPSAAAWGEQFERLGHQEPVEQHPEPPYLVHTVGIAYGWEKASAAIRELVLKHWPNARLHELRFEPDENEGIVITAANSRGLLHFFASEIASAQVRAEAKAAAAGPQVPSEEHVADVLRGVRVISQHAPADGKESAPYGGALEPRKSHGHQRVTGAPYEHEHEGGHLAHGHGEVLPGAAAEEPHPHKDGSGRLYEHRHTERGEQHGHRADLPDTNAEERQRIREELERVTGLDRGEDIDRLKEAWEAQQAAARKKGPQLDGND